MYYLKTLTIFSIYGILATYMKQLFLDKGIWIYFLLQYF